jgi:anti-sigma B factor antagonist
MAEMSGEPASELLIATERDAAGVPVLHVSGQLDISNARVLEDALVKATASRPAAIIFDLSALEFMDSAGISVLVRTQSEVPEVRLRNPSQIVRRLIEITGLHEVLPIEA